MLISTVTAWGRLRIPKAPSLAPGAGCFKMELIPAKYAISHLPRHHQEFLGLSAKPLEADYCFSPPARDVS